MDPGYDAGNGENILLDDPGGLTLSEAEDYQDALEQWDDDIKDLDGIDGYGTKQGNDIIQLEDDLDLDLLEQKINDLGYSYERKIGSNGEYINTVGTPDIGVFGEGRRLRLDSVKGKKEQKFRCAVIASYLSEKYDTSSSN